MTEVQRLQAELKAAKATAKAAKSKKAKKRVPASDRPMAPMTTGVSMERRPESAEWGVDHALLRFHSGEGDNTPAHAIGTRLNPDDATGFELRDEIMAYAKAHRVGKAKIRFDQNLGAWKGRADMFPPRLRTAAGYEIQIKA